MQRKEKMKRSLPLAIIVFILVFISGCSHLSDMDEHNQKITPLTEKDKQRLISQRAVIEKFISRNTSETFNYKTPGGKLGLLRAILTQDVFDKEQTYELQCMGVILGDVFVQEMKMEWIIVEDAYGRDPAVKMPGTSVMVFPVTMISKRIERGEKVDVFDLFNGVADMVEQQVKEEKGRTNSSTGARKRAR